MENIASKKVRGEEEPSQHTGKHAGTTTCWPEHRKSRGCPVIPTAVCDNTQEGLSRRALGIAAAQMLAMAQS